MKILKAKIMRWLGLSQIRSKRIDGPLFAWQDHAEKYGKHARIMLFLKDSKIDKVAFDTIMAEMCAAHIFRNWTLPNGATVKLRTSKDAWEYDRFSGHQASWITIDDELLKCPRDLERLRVLVPSPHRINPELHIIRGPYGRTDI